MKTLLVMVPMKPSLHPALKHKQRSQLSKMQLANPDLKVEVIVDERGLGDGNPNDLRKRVAHIAPIRQAMLDDYLEDHHDLVLWIDADINDYDVSLPTKLLERGEGNVAAPLVLHKDPTMPENYFYDNAGFVENGGWCDPNPPYFKQPGPKVELDGVGSFYMMPAPVYRAGGRYEASENYTEHYAVCCKAKEMGYKVFAFTDLIVYHARLMDYGEAQHG